MFSFLSGAMATASQRYFSFDLGKGDAEHLKTTFSVTFQIYVLIHISIYVSKSDTLDIRKRILYIYYIMKEKNNFIRGYVEIITLQMLIIEDSYGMKLVNDIRTISDGLIDLSVGTLYPTLYKLVEEGYVTDYKKLVGKRR